MSISMDAGRRPLTVTDKTRYRDYEFVVNRVSRQRRDPWLSKYCLYGFHDYLQVSTNVEHLTNDVPPCQSVFLGLTTLFPTDYYAP